MFFLFSIDMNTINIDHHSFSINITMFFRRLALIFYDILEILKGKLFIKGLKNIKSKKRKSAFIEHKVVGVFGIFPGLIHYLDEIFMEDILQNLILFTDLVYTKTRMAFRKMLVPDMKQNSFKIKS